MPSAIRRTAHYLGTHPSRSAGLNWTIWILVALVLIGIGAGSNADAKQRNAADKQSKTTTPTTAVTPSAHHHAQHKVTAHRRRPTRHPKPTRRPPAHHRRPVQAAAPGLPDRARTPGATNPAVTQSDIGRTICVSGWTATIRPDSGYTTGLKEQQLATGYAYRGDMNTSDYEEDHLISLELGGSSTSPKNLWPEPYATSEGARIKDRIENKLHGLVCAHQMSLAVAQHAIATNWEAAYKRYGSLYVKPVVRRTTTPPRSTQTTAPATPSGATGICNDGTYSYAAHHQGMCSHHGGVREFLD